MVRPSKKLRARPRAYRTAGPTQIQHPPARLTDEATIRTRTQRRIGGTQETRAGQRSSTCMFAANTTMFMFITGVLSGAQARRHTWRTKRADHASGAPSAPNFWRASRTEVWRAQRTELDIWRADAPNYLARGRTELDIWRADAPTYLARGRTDRIAYP